jgi:hypothetical protein
VLFPAKHVQAGPELWQAFEEELILSHPPTHDDLFAGLQAMMQGAIDNRPKFGIFLV